jgi:hypothetical protein
LKEYVEKKWGKKHSMVALELINILEAFLQNQERGIDPLQSSEHTHTISDNTVKRRYKSLNTSTNGDDRAARFNQEIEQLKQRIWELFPVGATSISKRALYRIIADTCKVTDKRAINTRLELLIGQGIILELGDNFYEIRPRPATAVADKLAVKSSVSNNGNGSYEEEQGYERIIHLKEANPVKDGYNGY